MPREKRKTRLNKGESGEFIGFCAFATQTDSASKNSTNIGQTSSSEVTGSNDSNKTIALQPIYTGDNNDLSLIFQRIGQKRDATTKVKALQELVAYFADESLPKKQKAEALAHFCYLFHSKLFYDNSTPIRAAAVSCLKEAATNVPKAWKNLASRQPEIAGMAFCLQGDPAAEVRGAATSFWDAVETETDSSSNDDDDGSTIFDSGITALVTRILAYGRPMAMHESLFAKKNESKLSEAQTEELDERFERIVVTILRGFQRWILVPRTSEMTIDQKLLWKSMSSNKASIRRNTYELLALCCQKAPYLVNADKIEKQLAQNLAVEKEPSVIPTMIETVLSFLAFLPKEQRQGIVESSFVKPVIKLLKRGCYGAPAAKWAPAILTFVAMPPKLSVRRNVLESLWEGRANVIGIADTLEVSLASAESASFLLAKEEEIDDPAIATAIANCWEGALGLCLSSEASGVSHSVHQRLSKGLATQMAQLDKASQNETSIIAAIKDDFWSNRVFSCLVMQGADEAHIATLFRDLETEFELPGVSCGGNICELLRKKFHHDLQIYQENQEIIASLNIFDCWVSTFSIVKPEFLFEEQRTSLTDFLKKDLLRWMVVHTSSTLDGRDPTHTKKDFTLLGKTWRESSTLWPFFLENLIECHCDIELLSCGLSTLLKAGCPVDEIKCTQLDSFCVDIARESVEEADGLETDEELSQETEIHAKLYLQTKGFLRFCAGVDGPALIDKNVEERWLEVACQTPEIPDSEERKNPVLEVLVELTKASTKWNESPSDLLVLESWKHGGDLWNSVVNDILALIGPSTSFIESAKSYLWSTLLALDDINVENEKDWQVRNWSRKASRLLSFCRDGKKAGLDGYPHPNLSAVGLDNIVFWKEKWNDIGNNVHLCMLSLVEEIPCENDRLCLFEKCDTSEGILAVQVFMSLSAGTTSLDLLRSEHATQRRDNCSKILNLLGGPDIPTPLLRSWSDEIIRLIAIIPSDKKSEGDVLGKHIAVLSQLLDLLMPTVVVHIEEASVQNIAAEVVEEGRDYFYLPDMQHPEIFDKVTVVKVHRDIPSELYFTISIEKDGKTQERQTVAERLRPYPSYTPPKVGRTADQHVDTRRMYAQKLCESVILPHAKTWNYTSFEMINIAFTQCGLGYDSSERGIGSNRFEIFKILSETQNLLIESLNASNDTTSKAVDYLWSLALALGYGMNARRSPEIMSQIRFDASLSISALLDHNSERGNKSDFALDLATLAFLTVTLPYIDEEEMIREGTLLANKLSITLLENTGSRTFSGNHVVVLRAMSAIQTLDLPPESSEDILYSKLVEVFTGSWGASWVSSNFFSNVFEGALQHRKSVIASAARVNANLLVASLFSESKCSFAFRLLCCFTDSGVPFHENPPDFLEDFTRRLVEQWSVSMIVEEKEELEEDIAIVAQHTPERMMKEIEEWDHHTENDQGVSEASIVGRFLCWLSFLRLVRTASNADSMNRQAFISYVSRSNGLAAIVGEALNHAQLGKDGKKTQPDESLSDFISTDTSSRSVEIPRLARSIIFRSVEIFPTLSKHWWEMDCPKYFSQSLLNFIESSVSSEILKDQLTEIGKAEAFGEMNVTGNSASREVTATYVQDDFTLSVVIRLPPSFPFRRAEVDCSKTLGVPESRWKRWALQITMMLNNQGGTLQDALLLWKENVDKEFEGVEPCPICYSVLHVKTHKLPAMECRTCSNRFHTDCLTQWFRNSGKSACVLCQQPWSGTRV